MKKIFPFYKGKNIANNPLGYTTKENARRRMADGEVIKDFEKTLSEDYWFKYLYTYKNGNRTTEFNLGAGKRIKIADTDIKQRIYIKDIDNEKIIELFKKLITIYEKNWYDRTSEEIEQLEELSLKISELGYYPYRWKDCKDYKKKYSAFVSSNVEFKEMEVNISIE